MAPRKRLLGISLGLAVLVIGALASPAGASVLAPRAAHSPNADDIRTAYWVALAVATVLFIAVNAVLIMAVVRFRDGRGRTPTSFIAGRGVFTRAAAPLLLLAAGLFVFAVVETENTRGIPSGAPSGLSSSAQEASQTTGAAPSAGQAGPLEINAVGQQWLWRFEYPVGTPGPPYEVFSYNELVVPVNTTVLLHVDSTDVTHRWFVPALGPQVDAVPGYVSDTWFRADHEGVYPGQSTSFSGPGYSAMRVQVRVVSADQFAAWVRQKRADIAAAQAFVQHKIQTGATVGGVRVP